MTFYDLERRNSLNDRVISPNLVAFGTDYVKVVEDRLHQYFLQRKCRPQNLGFSDISLMALLVGDHSGENVKWGTSLSLAKISTGTKIGDFELT